MFYCCGTTPKKSANFPFLFCYSWGGERGRKVVPKFLNLNNIKKKTQLNRKMKMSSFTAHTYTYIYVFCSLLIDPLTKALSARSILFCEVNTGNDGYLRSLERHDWSCGLSSFSFAALCLLKQWPRKARKLLGWLFKVLESLH